MRTEQEFRNGSISGATCVPVDDLRGRMAELPREKELLIFCEVGLRGYVAARMLAQHGFRVRNLSGGYKRYGCGSNSTTDFLRSDADLRGVCR